MKKISLQTAGLVLGRATNARLQAGCVRLISGELEGVGAKMGGWVGWVGLATLKRHTNASSSSVTAMWIAVSRQRMVSPAAYSGETFDWMADGFGAKRDYFLNVWVSCSLKTIFKI